MVAVINIMPMDSPLSSPPPPSPSPLFSPYINKILEKRLTTLPMSPEISYSALRPIFFIPSRPGVNYGMSWQAQRLTRSPSVA